MGLSGKPGLKAFPVEHKGGSGSHVPSSQATARKLRKAGSSNPVAAPLDSAIPVGRPFAKARKVTGGLNNL